MRHPFLSQVMDISSDGLFMVDTTGRICELNLALCLLLGYERHELLGQPCSLLGCDACSTVRLAGGDGWCSLFEQKLVMRRRCHLRHRDGTRIPVLKNARLVTTDSPHESGENVFSVESITDIRELVQRDAYIVKISQMLDSGGIPGMIGQAPCMATLFRNVGQAAQSDVPVFIHGESGTGKELVARALHQMGPRAQGPFIGVNCAALNRNILESELFGHVRGAFTGALRDRPGRFEAADGGTLFLDEIGDMPQEVQVKLLRVLETGQIERVGEHKSRTVNVRIVSATHRDLDQCIRTGHFREDLAYRVRVIPLEVPPLRQRREDIPLLVAHFLENLRLTGRGDKMLGAEAAYCLTAHQWPGNVRELRNAVTHAVVMSPGSLIGLEHLPAYLRRLDLSPGDTFPAPPMPTGPDTPVAPAPHAGPAGSVSPDPPPLSSLSPHQSAQQAEILAALAQSGYNVSQAARLLGIHRTTLINRMLRLGLRLNKSCRRL